MQLPALRKNCIHIRMPTQSGMPKTDHLCQDLAYHISWCSQQQRRRIRTVSKVLSVIRATLGDCPAKHPFSRHLLSLNHVRDYRAFAVPCSETSLGDPLNEIRVFSHPVPRAHWTQ